MTAYCTSDDLLVGNLKLDNMQNPTTFINQGGEQIESTLGFTYQVPFDVSEVSTMTLPARLLIKRINIWLASGRLILATFNAGEDKQLNAYGADLVEKAECLLQDILDGKIILNGAKYLDGTTASVSAGGLNATTPLIGNVDLDGSGFDAFYSGFMGNYPRYSTVTFDE